MPDAATLHREMFECIKQRDLARLRSLYHPDYVYTGGDGVEHKGPDAGVATAEIYLTAFEDLRFAIHNQYAPSPDVSVIECTGYGTQTRELLGIPPTGRSAEVPVCNVIEVLDGRIYREREYYDSLSLMQQLGVIPQDLQPATPFDIEALHRGHRERNAVVLASLYAEDAQILVVDATRPPKAPLAITGQEQILEFLIDICSRDMTHRIENECLTPERLAFNVACRYADGTNVLSAQICDLRDGLIVQETIVQAWDA